MRRCSRGRGDRSPLRRRRRPRRSSWCCDCASNSLRLAWTQVRTRSAGTWPATTARHCRGPRSTGSWSGPGRSCRRPRSGPSPPTSASKPISPTSVGSPISPTTRLTRPDATAGADTEILTWIDDCSRYLLSVTAHRRITGPIVLAAFKNTVAAYGVPASTLTDNGMVFTTRLSGGKGGRNGLETELRRLNVTQKNSRPNHPTTCGKVERVQQTMKNWLRAQPIQPATIAELQLQLEAFVEVYNQNRPHRSLPHQATPATIYHALPKATPSTSRAADTHDRVRHDKIDDGGAVTLRVNGRLHHIGVGRTHARTPVILLVHDLEVRIVAATTGELLRELTIDPRRDYQPTGHRPGPRRTQK